MQNMQTGGQMQPEAFFGTFGNYDFAPSIFNVSYDASTKTLDIPASAENKMYSEIYKMIGEVVEIKFYPVDGIIVREFLAKIERVNVDEDGVSLKLTTEEITKGAYAKKKVKESFDRVKSGEYSVSFIPALADEMRVFNEGSDSFILEPLAVELEVEGSKLKMKPKEERCLRYNKKEKRVGSVASEKVMEEIGKKLAEEEDQVNVKLSVIMKDGTELAMGLAGLERSGDEWEVKVSGGKKALDYLKSEKEYTVEVLLRACFSIFCL